MSDTSLLFSILAVDKATALLGRVGGSVDKLALGIAAAGGLIVAKTSVMAANFQTDMNRLVTSAGETHDNMALVSNGVLDMEGEVGDGAHALATALYTVESGGQHGANGLIVLQAAAEGAKAEQADLTTVADALTSVLADYHLKAADSALVTSEMVTAVGQGKTTFEQFSGSLHSVLPLASSLHVPLTDILGDLAAMTIHGESADQATQNMADALRHLASPTLAMQKEMSQLGINSQELSTMLSTKGLSGTMQYLSQTILSKMGPSGRVLLGTFNASKTAAEDVKKMVASMPPDMQKLAEQFQQGKITGADWTNQLKGMPPLQANLMRQFATLEKTATGFSGALRSGSPEAQNYIAALKAATGDATGLSVALMLTGENTSVVNDDIAKIAATTTEAGGHVKGWSDVQGTFNQKMAEAKGQAEALGIRIGTVLLPYLTQAVSAVSAGVTWLTKHKAVARDAAIAVGVLAGAVLLYKTYQLGANVADKIGIGIAAVKRGYQATVTASLYAYATAQAVLNARIWTWIGQQVIDLAGWLRKAALVVANTAVMIAHEAAIIAVTTATYVWTAAQWLLNVAMDANPVGLIVLAIAAVIAIVVILWTHSKAFRDFFIGIWHDIWGFLKGVGHWFAHDFVDFFVNAWDWIKAKFMAAAIWLRTKIEEVKLVLRVMWDILKTKFEEVVAWLAGKWTALIANLSSIGHRIASAASGMWDGIKNSFKGAINWLLERWNGLQFKIPSIDFMGIHTPGFTLGVPKIPLLARGGEMTTGGPVVVGDHGPEVAYMPRGATVRPLTANSPGGGGNTVVCVHLHGSLEGLVTEIGAHIRGNYQGDVQVALGGAHS